MGSLQLTYQPKLKTIHSHEAKSVQLWLSVDPLAEKFPNEGSYVYCGNNPINLVDPDGKRKIVISGGADLHNKNRMNFANASKVQLINYVNSVKKSGTGEKISWIIFDLDYSATEKKEFNNWAKKRGVEVSYVKSAKEVIAEVNKSSTSSDKITEMSSFSHGTPSNLAYGYDNTGYTFKMNDKTNLNLYNVGDFDKNAFSGTGSIDLFSCNAGTPTQNLKQDFNSRLDLINSSISLPNLVEGMSNSTGQKTTGFIGRTNYVPTAFGKLPSAGSTGGDYSPTVNGVSIPSIKIESNNGSTKAN